MEAPKLSEVIHDVCDWALGWPEVPSYDSLDWHSQNRLLAAYIREAPNDMGEIIHYLQDRMHPKDVADFIEDGTEIANTMMFWAAVKTSARLAFENAIDNCIQDEFRDYCSSNGIYRSNGPDEPDDLVGFREN